MDTNHYLENIFKKYLDFYWLRPEMALCLAFRSKAMQDVKFLEPSIEISCGDGTALALHLGAEFDVDHDYYYQTNAKIFSHNKKKVIDIYDNVQNNSKPKSILKKEADVKITYGTDIKKSLLKKAKRTKLYRNLIEFDNNNISLPFSDSHFKTIYSNSIYWVKDVENFLQDINRILMPKGVLVLDVITPRIFDTLDKLEEYLSPNGIKILDRNRTKVMPSVKKFNEWKTVIIDSGFKIKKSICIYPDSKILDIWNIGIRPISHILIQLMEDINLDKRRIIKDEWVEIFYEILKPFLISKKVIPSDESAGVLFILEK